MCTTIFSCGNYSTSENRLLENFLVEKKIGKFLKDFLKWKNLFLVKVFAYWLVIWEGGKALKFLKTWTRQGFNYKFEELNWLMASIGFEPLKFRLFSVKKTFKPINSSIKKVRNLQFWRIFRQFRREIATLVFHLYLLLKKQRKLLFRDSFLLNVIYMRC